MSERSQKLRGFPEVQNLFLERRKSLLAWTGWGGVLGLVASGMLTGDVTEFLGLTWRLVLGAGLGIAWLKGGFRTEMEQASTTSKRAAYPVGACLTVAISELLLPNSVLGGGGSMILWGGSIGGLVGALGWLLVETTSTEIADTEKTASTARTKDLSLPDLSLREKVRGQKLQRPERDQSTTGALTEQEEMGSLKKVRGVNPGRCKEIRGKLMATKYSGTTKS